MVGCGLSVQLWRLSADVVGKPGPSFPQAAESISTGVDGAGPGAQALIRKESCEFLAEASPELQGVQGDKDLHLIL